MKYIETEPKIIAPGEKVLIENQCKNPVEIAAGLIFREDGTYTISVYNGKITVWECGAPHEKLDEIPSEIL